MTSSRSQSGFSLIEVLITAFIFSTALMGAIAIQAVAKKSSFEAQQRTVASYLGTDIIERLRLNKLWLQGVLAAGSYEVTGVGDNSLSAPSCSESNGGMKDCNGSDLNQHNLFQWQELMLGSLIDNDGSPFPTLSKPLACIVIDSTGLTGVMITWLGRNSRVDATKAGLAQFGQISDARLTTLLGSVTNLTSFSNDCGLSDDDRHVYGMVTMIR